MLMNLRALQWDTQASVKLVDLRVRRARLFATNRLLRGPKRVRHRRSRARWRKSPSPPPSATSTQRRSATRCPVARRDLKKRTARVLRAAQHRARVRPSSSASGAPVHARAGASAHKRRRPTRWRGRSPSPAPACSGCATTGAIIASVFSRRSRRRRARCATRRGKTLAPGLRPRPRRCARRARHSAARCPPAGARSVHNSASRHELRGSIPSRYAKRQ